MIVTKLKLIDVTTQRELAYLYPDDQAGWRDPFGGEFSEEEKRQMSSVAKGDFAEVLMHAGTKHQRTVYVRFAADFV